MHPTPAPAVRRRPPVAALLAAPLALISAVVVGFFGVIALAFSGGDLSGGGWLVVTVPVVLSVVLVVGAVLLLLGRSWLVLCLPAAALALFVVFGLFEGSLEDGTDGFVLLIWAVPAGTALLCVLPGVRRWVAARRQARRSGGGASAPGWA